MLETNDTRNKNTTSNDDWRNGAHQKNKKQDKLSDFGREEKRDECNNPGVQNKQLVEFQIQSDHSINKLYKLYAHTHTFDTLLCRPFQSITMI